MRVLSYILVFGLALTLFGMGSAYADGNYWTAEVGAFSSDESAFDTGFTIQGALGTPAISFFPSLAQGNPLWPKVCFEAGIGYSHAEFDRSIGVPGVPGFIQDVIISVEGNVDVIPVTATAIVRHPLNNNFGLYGGGGLGLYYVKLEAAGFNDSSFELGFHLEGGVAYEINEQIELTAEFQWATVGEDAAGGTNINFGIRKSF